MLTFGDFNCQFDFMLARHGESTAKQRWTAGTVVDHVVLEVDHGPFAGVAGLTRVRLKSDSVSCSQPVTGLPLHTVLVAREVEL
jgi:hypothetical protein